MFVRVYLTRAKLFFSFLQRETVLMFINIGVSVLVIAAVLVMLFSPKPDSLFYSNGPGVKDRGFSNLFPQAQGYIQQVDSARSYLVGGCNGLVGKGFNVSLQSKDSTTSSSKVEGHFGDSESRVGLVKDLFVEGKGPVAYLLDMKCCDRGKYYHKSDVSFEDGRLVLQCSKRGFKGSVDVKRPLRFHTAVIEALEAAVKFNNGLKKAIAAVFCETLTLRKNRELAMEMYLRIATAPLDTLEAGLFPLSKDEKKAREAAAAEAEKKEESKDDDADDAKDEDDSDESDDSDKPPPKKKKN